MRFVLATTLFTLLASAAPYGNSSRYDYVVIGSGPGGGTLATNLARSGHSVFLIEAGGDNGESLYEQIPFFSAVNAESNNASWSFFVNHYQNETQARRDNKYTYLRSNGSYYVGLDPPEDAQPLGIYYPRGATLGGSSQVNAMNFLLPPDDEWKRIADLTGDDSWLPDNMRQYFMELERNRFVEEGTPGHGFDGYISSMINNASFISTDDGPRRIAAAAARILEGVDLETPGDVYEYFQRDFNRDDPERYEVQGAYSMPQHVNELRRRSGVRNYIVDTLNARYENGSRRYPLTLSTHSLATRVLFKKGGGSKPKAYGVEYLAGEGLYSADRRYDTSQTGEAKRVIATREVIVAGGAYNTPQILKLSGVGPREELESFGIEVVADLPAVGKYLQDNYETAVIARARVPISDNPLADCALGSGRPLEEEPCVQQWLANGQNVLGQAGSLFIPLFRSSVSENNDTDIIVIGSSNAEFRGFYPGYATDLTLFSETAFSWSIVKMQVGNAAGTVTLRSTDPRDTPIIDFNYFQENAEKDLQAISEAADMLLKVLDSAGAPYAPFQVVEPPADRDVKQGAMDHSFGHHASSSCRMGPKGDTDYCVDSKFRVNGVEGLRVVDGSVFPRTPGGFPAAPVFVISRKAYHAIIEDLGDE